MNSAVLSTHNTPNTRLKKTKKKTDKTETKKLPGISGKHSESISNYKSQILPSGHFGIETKTVSTNCWLSDCCFQESFLRFFMAGKLMSDDI